jgi:hypothetical protein
MKELRLVAPSKLGYGINVAGFKRALEYEPDLIGIDAGSTDMGPYYLGSQQPFYSRLAIKKDLELILPAAVERRIPLIVGSAVALGTNAQLAFAADIVREVARERGLSFKLALVEGEVSKETLRQYLRRGPIEPLGQERPLTEADVEASAALVAQMGVEPLIEALDGGAEVILAGRCCDDAIFAALPVKQGFDQGLALHLGKVLECASMSAVPADLHGPMVGTIRADHFLLEPAEPHRVCTPASVAAHSLYEREDPYLQPGPGGVNDLSQTVFSQESERAVRVAGSRWLPDPVYKVKLEGAALVGHRAICITGVRDRVMIQSLDQILAEAEQQVAERFAEQAGRYQLIFRAYGKNGVMGPREPVKRTQSHELGLLTEAIAETPELAYAVCMMARGILQHCYFPGQLANAGNMAYPFTPFVVPAGEAYRFNVEHLLPLEQPGEIFPIRYEQVGQAAAVAVR